MAKIIPITEHYQHFLAEMKESFWGDVYGQTRELWEERLEADSRRERDRYAVREVYRGGAVGGSLIATAITSGIL